MTDAEQVRVELVNLEKDTLIEVIMSGKLPDSIENNRVKDYLEKECVLRRENVTDPVETTEEADIHLLEDTIRLKRRCCFKGRRNDSASQLKSTDTIIADGNFYWRNYIPNNIPADAVSIADGEYIGQVNYFENLLPVVIFPKENKAFGERAGKRVFDENIKILCAPDSKKFYWQSVDFDQPNESTMKNVVKGGHQDGYPLYIGRGSDQYQSQQIKIGKVVPMTNVSCKGLQVWGNYDECVIIRQFQILKYCASTIAHEDPVLSGFYWREHVPNKIPNDAIEGADGKYIGQVSYHGDIPVTLYPSENTAVLEKDGNRAVVQENIKILCSKDSNKFHWEEIDLKETAEKGPIKNAVVGGYRDGFYLFIGRISHEGEWKIGKVILSYGIGQSGLYIWSQEDKLVVVHKFEILKYDANEFQKNRLNIDNTVV